MAQHERSTAYYHLPGLFEFYELYRVFLPLFREHREYFYDWCEIGSVYGAPADCIWGGGRTGFGPLAGVARQPTHTSPYFTTARSAFSAVWYWVKKAANPDCSAGSGDRVVLWASAKTQRFKYAASVSPSARCRRYAASRAMP